MSQPRVHFRVAKLVKKMERLLTFLVRIRLDFRFLWASWHSLILKTHHNEARMAKIMNLSVKARLVLFQWTDMSEAALLMRLLTSYLSCRVAERPAAQVHL